MGRRPLAPKSKNRIWGRFARKDLQRIFDLRTIRASRSVYSILVEAMRNSWTDERLDDGFDRVTSEIKLLRGELGQLRAEMKAEFKAVRSEMKAEFKAIRSEMKAEFESVRNEMKAEFESVRSEMKAEFVSVRNEMKAEFKAVRHEMKAEFESVRGEIASLRKEMHEGFASLNRTLLQVGGGIIAALIGVIATQL